MTDSSIKTKLGQALTHTMRKDMQAKGISESEIYERARRSLQRLAEAPATILLCRDKAAVKANEAEEIIMSIQSVAAAGLQLLLAAHAEGLGGNWICWPLYAQDQTQQALELPESWDPQAMFFIGYPDGTAKEKVLKNMEDVVVIYDS